MAVEGHLTMCVCEHFATVIYSRLSVCKYQFYALIKFEYYCILTRDVSPFTLKVWLLVNFTWISRKYIVTVN